MVERVRRAASVLRPAVLVPVVLVLGLVVLVVAGALSGDRAAAVARASIGDTGPVLAGAPLPADGSAGSATVELSPAAAAHPQAAAVRDLVQRSVDARNGGSYDAWRATIAQSVRTDADVFATETRTMRTGSMVLRRIDPVGRGELVVPLGYITTQDPADAPPDVRVPRLCWQVSAVIEAGSNGLRLLVPRAGSQLRTPC
jgi:hypothetical protein